MPTKKSTTTKRKTVTRHTRCQPSFSISEAGYLLKKKRSSKAGKALATEGKAQKAKRKQRGCLHGVSPKRLGKSFELSAKQKRNLPLALQKAILNYHRGK